MNEQTSGAVKFVPHDTKDWVEKGATIFVELEAGDIITQRHLHIELGKYFNTHGKYPEKVTMAPEQWLHLRAALGLYGLVKQYEYMEFILEPVQVDNTHTLTVDEMPSHKHEVLPDTKTSMEKMEETKNVA